MEVMREKWKPKWNEKDDNQLDEIDVVKREEKGRGEEK